MQNGTIRDWKDDRGFGFIRPDSGGKDVFLHISAVENRARRPLQGDSVTFTTTQTPDGRLRATNVRIAVPPVARTTNPIPYLISAFCVGAASYLMIRTGLPIVFVYPVLGLITYVFYAHDKRQAQAGGFRVPEATLHLLELLGGWCGAYMAQETLRHKTAKDSYQTIFWGIVLLHGVGWALWLIATVK